MSLPLTALQQEDYLERLLHTPLRRNSSCTRRGLRAWRSADYPVRDTFVGRTRTLGRRNLRSWRSSLAVESHFEGGIHSLTVVIEFGASWNAIWADLARIVRPWTPRG